MDFCEIIEFNCKFNIVYYLSLSQRRMGKFSDSFLVSPYRCAILAVRSAQLIMHQSSDICDSSGWTAQDAEAHSVVTVRVGLRLWRALGQNISRPHHRGNTVNHPFSNHPTICQIPKFDNNNCTLCALFICEIRLEKIDGDANLRNKWKLHNFFAGLLFLYVYLFIMYQSISLTALQWSLKIWGPKPWPVS